MSPRLSLRISESRQSRFREKSRKLINAREPPGAIHDRTRCDAIGANGQPCERAVSTEKKHWCDSHIAELADWYEGWSKLQDHARQIGVTDAHKAKRKVLALHSTVELRRQIHQRFRTRSSDSQGFVDWIEKLEQELFLLTEELLILPRTQCSVSSLLGSSHHTEITILQSPPTPEVLVKTSDGVDSEAALIVQQFSDDLCASAINRLYSVVPDLRPSKFSSDSLVQTEVIGDVGTQIVRCWFRIMILHDSDPESLARATRARSIDEYLFGCRASHLESYCDFFETSWMPNAARYLRVAVCAQTLAGGDVKTVRLLGGDIPSTLDGLQMKKTCWDILYRWFPTLFTPNTIKNVCANFEDNATLCKLLALGLYQERWYDPKSILSECAISVFFGLCPRFKGNLEAQIGTTMNRQSVIQTEVRNYFHGQMAINGPMAQLLFEELYKRSGRLYVVVYEGTSMEASIHPPESELFIKRTRTAEEDGELSRAGWAIDMTLKDLKHQLLASRKEVHDSVTSDSWQFIIIDREPGLPFELIDIVQDTLLMLAGDPSHREIAKHVISELIPPSASDRFLQNMAVDCSADMRFPPPPKVQYEGHRYRHHALDESMAIVHEEQQKRRAIEGNSRDNRRFIQGVVEDMERCGIVSLIEDYEEPQTCPVTRQGSDGALDLYFPYDADKAGSMISEIPIPEETCLVEFAQAFKQHHPSAIMAKGCIETHYCAWPMPVIKSIGEFGLTFATWEGHIYRWNAMPFDRPWSVNAWQYYLQRCINSRYPFVFFYMRTFVICALDVEDAEDKMAMLLEETTDRGWKIVLPRPSKWKSDVDELKLGTLFRGIGPA